MGVFSLFEIIFLATLLIGVATGTWLIQDWRWQSKETNYVKAQMAQLQKEESKADKAATQFEKKQEGSNDTYKKIDKALNAIPPQPSVVCFGTRRLHVVNSALARKAPAPGGPSATVPGPDAATGK